MLHGRALHHHRSLGNQRPPEDLDGRLHATTGWPRQAHGSRNLQGCSSGKGVLRRRHARQPRRVVGRRANRELVMTRIAWPLVELVSRLLEPEEREAVLGDLLEAKESAGQALLDIFGLILRRQAFLWKNPQPWFAGFSVALPCTYLLMQVSVSVTATYERLFHHRLSPFVLPLLPADGLVLGWRLCSRLGLAPHPLGQRHAQCLGLRFLFAHLP